MHRRTRPTMRIRTEPVASSSSSPGEKSVNGRENMTSASSRLERRNRRYAVASAHRSATGSSVSASADSSENSRRKPSKYSSRTTPDLSPKSS